MFNRTFLFKKIYLYSNTNFIRPYQSLTSKPKIVYTGHFDRIEKKAAIDCDKDIPTLLNHTVECQPGVFFQNFVLAGLCWQEQWTVSCF